MNVQRSQGIVIPQPVAHLKTPSSADNESSSRISQLWYIAKECLTCCGGLQSLGSWLAARWEGDPDTEYSDSCVPGGLDKAASIYESRLSETVKPSFHRLVGIIARQPYFDLFCLQDAMMILYHAALEKIASRTQNSQEIENASFHKKHLYQLEFVRLINSLRNQKFSYQELSCPQKFGPLSYQEASALTKWITQSSEEYDQNVEQDETTDLLDRIPPHQLIQDIHLLINSLSRESYIMLQRPASVYTKQTKQNYDMKCCRQIICLSIKQLLYICKDTRFRLIPDQVLKDLQQLKEDLESSDNRQLSNTELISFSRRVNLLVKRLSICGIEAHEKLEKPEIQEDVVRNYHRGDTCNFIYERINFTLQILDLMLKWLLMNATISNNRFFRFELQALGCHVNNYSKLAPAYKQIFDLFVEVKKDIKNINDSKLYNPVYIKQNPYPNTFSNLIVDVLDFSSIFNDIIKHCDSVEKLQLNKDLKPMIARLVEAEQIDYDMYCKIIRNLCTLNKFNNAYLSELTNIYFPRFESHLKELARFDNSEWKKLVKEVEEHFQEFKAFLSVTLIAQAQSFNKIYDMLIVPDESLSREQVEHLRKELEFLDKEKALGNSLNKDELSLWLNESMDNVNLREAEASTQTAVKKIIPPEYEMAEQQSVRRRRKPKASLKAAAPKSSSSSSSAKSKEDSVPRRAEKHQVNDRTMEFINRVINNSSDTKLRNLKKLLKNYFGLVRTRQKGGHLTYTNADSGVSVTLPEHRAIKLGTARGILIQADKARSNKSS